MWPLIILTRSRIDPFEGLRPLGQSITRFVWNPRWFTWLYTATEIRLALNRGIQILCTAEMKARRMI